MSKLIKFEVKPFDAVRVIGKPVICPLNEGEYNPVPDMWETMKQDGSLDFLKSLPDRSTPDPDTVGWMGEYNPETNSFTYIVGILAKPASPVPDGYVFRDLPACNIGIGWIQGSDDDGDIYGNAHNHTAETMQEYGFEYDYSAGGWEIEYYSEARFVAPYMNGEKILVLDYYSPCKPRQ